LAAEATVTRSSPEAAFAFEQLEPPPAGAPAARPTEPVQDIAAVQAQAEAIRAEARQAGHEEGFRAGAEEALESMRPAAASLAEAAGAVREERAQNGEALERHAVDLALALAEKALQAAVEVDPERVVDVVRGAMRLLVEREDVTVYVNPLDVDVVREAVEGEVDGAGGPRIEVLDERRVARGGAVVRTSLGEIDARLETKLEQARELLLSELSA
jgi:flagellar assembly protein FliH